MGRGKCEMGNEKCEMRKFRNQKWEMRKFRNHKCEMGKLEIKNGTWKIEMGNEI